MGGATMQTGTGRLAVVPVLLYHAVTATPGRHIAPFTVRPDEFARHLDAVLATGRRAVRFSDLVAGEHTAAEHGSDGGAGAGQDRRRPVVITFDDGYADFAESALPALLARSLPSTLFLTTGWLAGGTSREPGPSDAMLSWSQLPELLEAGVELGAHSHSHPQLDTLSGRALREELRTPKDLLEAALGQRVDLFAYPHGYSGPRVRRATRDSGYRAAAAVRNVLHQQGTDPFATARLTVTTTTTTDDITRWLDGVGVPVAGPGESLTTTGWRMYRRGRAIVRGRPGSDYR
jgi:peptidoglycan/xylan/chitin deacetylase (PgdA/CDA1 family)